MNGILIVAKSMLEINILKSRLSDVFEMKDFGDVQKIVGMEIHKDRKVGKLYL